MSIDTQLFEGKLIHLGPIDHENDPEVESRWTHDISFLRAMDRKIAMPLSIAQVKKRYETIEKEVDESKKLFYFTIRVKEDNRLLGYTRIEWIEWSHGTGNLKMAIGDPSDRNKGYGTDALRLMLHFAFAEINLFRLAAIVSEDNPGALGFFKRYGFIEEVRRRQAIFRDGKTWDLIHLGLLRDEWHETAKEGEASHE